jgi:hypothetical protein
MHLIISRVSTIAAISAEGVAFELGFQIKIDLTLKYLFSVPKSALVREESVIYGHTDAYTILHVSLPRE